MRALPWAVATAAVVMAAIGWWPQAAEIGRGSMTVARIGQWQAERDRERLLASSDVGLWRWASDSDKGDVVWDRRAQRGFLLLRGFVPNDPSRAQYQLWIFDAARDERYPVDGGVFDIPSGRDEVVVPVHPTLPVSRAVAFAVTVERPGGAVVSNREKIVAFARTGL